MTSELSQVNLTHLKSFLNFSVISSPPLPLHSQILIEMRTNLNLYNYTYGRVNIEVTKPLFQQ